MVFCPPPHPSCHPAWYLRSKEELKIALLHSSPGKLAGTQFVEQSSLWEAEPGHDSSHASRSVWRDAAGDTTSATLHRPQETWTTASANLWSACFLKAPRSGAAVHLPSLEGQMPSQKNVSLYGCGFSTLRQVPKLGAGAATLFYSPREGRLQKGRKYPGMEPGKGKTVLVRPLGLVIRAVTWCLLLWTRSPLIRLAGGPGGPWRVPEEWLGIAAVVLFFHEELLESFLLSSFFKIKVKLLVNKISHSKVYDSVVFSTSTLLGYHPLCLVPRPCDPKENPAPITDLFPIPLFPSLWQPPMCVLCLHIYPLWAFYLNGAIEYVTCYVWKTFSRFTHVVAWVSTSFFFLELRYNWHVSLY